MNIFSRLFGRRRVAAEPQPIGNFTVSQQLGSSGRSVQFAGYFYQGESEESLRDRLDVVRSIVEREKTFAEIPELEAKREQMVKGLQQAREVLAGFEERRKAGEQLSSQERMNMRNLQQSIEKVNEEIDRGTEAIQEARKKVGARG